MLFNFDQTEIIEKARRIRLLALDVDGVLTDGGLYFSNAGEELKAFSILDGQGIKLLQSCGIGVAIITGRQSALVARRADELTINLLIQGREDKLTALTELCGQTGNDQSEVAYVGDDLPDIQVIRQVGLGFAVDNAHNEVKNVAHAQTERRGGSGAVREVCDFILQAQGRYAEAIAPFL